MPLSLSQLAKLLWAAQGITRPDGHRTAPSAGGIFPLKLFAVVGNVEDVEPGVYRYSPQKHTLRLTISGDRRPNVMQAAFGQAWMLQSAAIIALAADYSGMTEKYGKRGIRYLYLEAGAAGQNIGLEAAALNLGAVFIGAFDDSHLSQALKLGSTEYPLALMPVGVPA